MATTPDNLDIEKIRAEIMQIMATTSKINAETSKINRERFWLPFTIFGGVFAAVATIVIKLIG